MLPKRKRTRLKDYDYSQNGLYFVTICTYQKKNLFWNNCRVDPCGQPVINYTDLGSIANNTVRYIEDAYNVFILKYIVMPNHIHMIISIDNSYDDRLTARVNPTISQIVGAYKSKISSDWLKICKKNNYEMGKIWQFSFHDHIIRNEQKFQLIWEYIDNNPMNWKKDCFYDGVFLSE